VGSKVATFVDVTGLVNAAEAVDGDLFYEDFFDVNEFNDFVFWCDQCVSWHVPSLLLTYSARSALSRRWHPWQTL